MNSGNNLSSQLNYVRLHVIIFVFIVGFSTIAAKLFLVGFYTQKSIVRERAQIQQYRSDIHDCNGLLVASSLDTKSLYANPKIMLDHKEAALRLCETFPDLNYHSLINEFSLGKNFVWIKRNLTPKEQYQVNNLGIPGLFFEQSKKRIYPHKELLSHLIGYVGLDGKGLAGAEKYFDKELTRDDKSLNLTIDVRAQNIVHEELKQAVADFSAVGAIGLILDAKNGELIASVSLPDFDPHNPANASDNQLFNKFSLGLYEPGSTFKSYTMAMALDSESVKIDDLYDVNTPIRAARFNIHDYHAKGGFMSVPEIFMYSSNIGTAKIALDIGKLKQQNLLKLYGLLDPLNLQIPERASPMYPSESRWSDISTMTISYGHGIAITPLHIVRTMAALVNGGYLYDISIVKSDKPKLATKIISEKTSKIMQKLFRLSVSSGTGRKANVKGYLVGGKTGTSIKPGIKGGYNQNNRMSSFLAAFPINDPKYIVLAILDEPKGNKSTSGYATGGMTAAPVISRIISRLGPLYNIDIVDEEDPDIIKDTHLEYISVRDEINSF